MDPFYTQEQSRTGLRRSAGLFNLKLTSPTRTRDHNSPPSPTSVDPINEDLKMLEMLSPDARQPLSHVGRQRRSHSLKRPNPFSSKPSRSSFLTRTSTTANHDDSSLNLRKHSADVSFQGARPLQTVFAGSGLLSKRNIHQDSPQQRVPDTPCKRTFVNEESTPLRRLQRFSIHSLSETPETPTKMLTSTPLPKALQSADPSHSLLASNNITSLTSSSPQTPETPDKSSFDTHNTTISHKSFTPSATSSPRPKHLRVFSPVKVPPPINTQLQDDIIQRESTPHTPFIDDSPFFDDHLYQKFDKVQTAQLGEFSAVFVVVKGKQKLAVKRTKRQLLSTRENKRLLEEVSILRRLSFSPHIVQLVDHWDHNGFGYILTEFCENGDLAAFLTAQGRVARLEEWRVWKILAEVLQGIEVVHANNILHLDLKPANVFVTFEGHLKIGDFGMATRCPVPPNFEREGDREYIAPEVLERQQYCTSADIFSIGIMMVEVAANIVLPDNGVHWQRLRSGDLSDAGRLSSGDLSLSHGDVSHSLSRGSRSSDVPSWAPKFLVDGSQMLDKLVSKMLNPAPEKRPSAKELLMTPEIELVLARGQAGAVVYEGEFGPEPDEECEVWQVQ